jgi:hypothetical protein
LGPAATDAGEPLDGVTGFADGAGRMFDEVLFDRGAEVIQRAVLSLPADLVQAVDATLEYSSRDRWTERRDSPASWAMVSCVSPWDFSPITSIFWVMVPLVADDVEDVGWEREITHGSLPE